MKTAVSNLAFKKNKKGFLLFEALIGSAIFILMTTMTILVLIASREASLQSGSNVRATYVSDSALEGARNIRDQSFNKLVNDSINFNAPYSITLSGATNLWAYTGSAVTYDGKYKNTITLTSLGLNWVRVASQTEWKHGYTRSGSVVLNTELTDWTSTGSIGDWSDFSLDGSFLYANSPPDTPHYNDVAIKGNYAFVSSGDAMAGNDISVFDITNTSAPTFVTKITLLGSVGDLAIRGHILYALVNDDNAEIQAFDISNPSSPALVTSFNLPGASLGLSLAISSNVLLVGSTTDLSSYDITVPSTITFGESLLLGGNINRIRTQGSVAFVATSNSVEELTVLFISSYQSLSIYNGYDLPDPSPAATAIAVSGTSALIGTLSGSSIQELSLLTLPTFTPGPWTYEVSRKVTGIDMDPLGCYGFLVSEYHSKELRILRLSNSVQQVAYYTTNVAMGAARNVRYDPIRDRLFVTTDTSLLIFKPGSLKSPCTP